VTRKNPDEYVLRSSSGVITFWLGAVVMAGVLAIPLVQADWRLFWFLFAPALLFTWTFWIVLYRPAVYYDPARAIVVNGGRTHVLPWGHVTNVRQAISMVFELDAGKPVQAWGVPAQRRRGIIGSALDRRTRPTHELHQEADLLDSFRRVAPPAPEPVSASWDIVPLAIGAVLVIAVVVEFAVGI
jgi:hypothetical protein